MNVITIEQLSKTYADGKKALDSITLSLEQGEIFGFLGPNGAGKTTTVKLLNGMISPTSGSCTVFGLSPSQEPEKIHSLSGVLTEHAQMYDHMTGLENLIFYGSVFNIPESESLRRAKVLLDDLELSDAANKKLSAYSTGMRQKLSLARALIHQPKVLFLDEPTSGLDPESTQKVHSVIRNLAEESGVTVFLCTHQLRYAQEICTRYGLIDKGHLFADGSLQQLRSRISLGVNVKIKADKCPSITGLNKISKNTFEINLKSEEDIPAIVNLIVEAGGKIYGVSAQLPSLEDIYFSLTSSEKEGK